MARRADAAGRYFSVVDRQDLAAALRDAAVRSLRGISDLPISDAEAVATLERCAAVGAPFGADWRTANALDAGRDVMVSQYHLPPSCWLTRDGSDVVIVEAGGTVSKPPATVELTPEEFRQLPPGRRPARYRVLHAGNVTD